MTHDDARKITLHLRMVGLRLDAMRAGLTLDAYPKDPNPENWRTINGAKVHLENGTINGGAGGKFSGKAWTGKVPHKNASQPKPSEKKFNTWGDIIRHIEYGVESEENLSKADAVLRGKYNLGKWATNHLRHKLAKIYKMDDLLSSNNLTNEDREHLERIRKRDMEFLESDIGKIAEEERVMNVYNASAAQIFDAQQKWHDAKTKKAQETAAQNYMNAIMERDRKINPNAFPDTLAGVSRGTPMTPDKADLKNANPQYGTSREYKVNCQTCVVCYEARLRGYDVVATGNTEDPNSPNEKLAHDITLAWKTPKGWNPTVNKVELSFYDKRYRTTPKKLVDWLEHSVRAGERYILAITWNPPRLGHVVNVWRNPRTSKVEIIDSQTGKKVSQKYGTKTGDLYESLESVFAESDLTFLHSPGIMRIDNLEFDTGFVGNVLKQGGST